MKVAGFNFFVGVVVAMVVAAVAVGLYLAGSPNTERGRRFDTERVNALAGIAAAVDSYYGEKGALPPTTEALTTENIHLGPFVDPKTGEPYEYQVTGVSTYELCAVFEYDSQAMSKSRAESTPVPVDYYRGAPSSTWDHGTGRSCFPLDAEARLARPSCSLRNPCVAGQTCALLPNVPRAVCVPEGRECLAAGCPNACTLLESYPVEVRCGE